MTNVRVKVNEARLQQFVSVKKVGEDEKGKALYTRETRTLRPMTNLVPREVVEQMRQNVPFMAKVRAGLITIEDGDLPAEALTSLDHLKPVDAVKLVQETVDKDQLETWRATAKGRVLAAIDTQIVKIDETLNEKKE